MNDHSVYRDLIATQKPACILRLSAASKWPGINILLPETPFIFLLSFTLLSFSFQFPSLLLQINFFVPTPSPASLSVCALNSLRTQQQQMYAFSSHNKKSKNRHTHTHIHTIHTCACDYSMWITWECRHLDVIISNICLFCS